MEWSIVTRYAAVVFFGLFLGFLSAIPIGAVQLQVVKLSLAGRRRTAITTALGSGTSDLIYGALTLFGLGHVLESARYQAAFYLLGAVVLSCLLCRSIMDMRDHASAGEVAQAREGSGGFLLGFTLAITNPSIVLWWIVGFRVFIDFGLFPEVTVALRALFILSGAAGLVGYLVALSIGVGRFRRSASDELLGRLNLAIVILLAALVLYFGYSAASFAAR